MASESIAVYITIDHDLACFRSLIGILPVIRELTLFTTVSIAVFKPVETQCPERENPGALWKPVLRSFSQVRQEAD